MKIVSASAHLGRLRQMPLAEISRIREIKRIEVFAVQQHFQMKVRSRRITGASDLCDHVPGLDRLAVPSCPAKISVPWGIPMSTPV